MAKQEKLKIIALGGLNEVGKNITVFEYQDDIIAVDCGIAFPDSEMPGIDLVLPDFTYLTKNKDKVKGLILTHGHEDHIGGISYLLKELSVPIFGTNMTLGLLKKKLEEHGLHKSAKLNIIKPREKFKLGIFEIEPIRVNHSIAEAVGYAIKTPMGVIIHTGDFKIDSTPIIGEPIDLTRFAEYGRQGVLALLMDSTNVERPGYTMSERTVGESFDKIFASTNKRIIIASFASNVDRVQQIVNSAVKTGRKIAVSGRSMENMVEVAMELGYMNVPKGLFINLDEIGRTQASKLVIVTTGSQGEPMSALYRMAYSDHRKVELGPEDLVILSANPIPGNEKLVNKIINELYKKGCDVLLDSDHSVHVSGHACQEELKIIMTLTKPKFFIPVHGEYRMLYRHAKLAELMGIQSKNIVISDIGKVIELDKKTCRLNGTVPSGRIFVDGLGVGDVGNIVIRDRQHLAKDGLIIIVAVMDSSSGLIVSGPDIVSRGFVYVRESEEIMSEMRKAAKRSLEECEANNIKDWTTMKNKLKASIGDLIYEQTKRKPMILPIIMEM